MWKYDGSRRPEFAAEPRDGQESVWDYPRPPVMQADPREVIVEADGQRLARTRAAVRVLETAGAPTFYLPPDDVVLDLLCPVRGQSFCEWKGVADYLALAAAPAASAVAWRYQDPNPAFAAIKNYLGFYPGRVECFVDRERVRPQPGGFYGGWVTSEIVGPIKGEAGSEGW